MPTVPPARDWAVVLCGVLAAALVTVVSMQFWGLWLFGSRVDYAAAGTWAEMLSGVGTTLAVGLALSGLWLERRKHARELARAREREMTDVHAWLSPMGAPGPLEWIVTFENRTTVPIYLWRLEVLGCRIHVCSAVLGAIRPGHTSLHAEELRGTKYQEAPATRLHFGTGDGRWWSRGDDGVARESSAGAAGCSLCHSD